MREKIDHNSSLKAYLTEIDYYKEWLKGREIISIFFGGGTPSTAKPFVIEGIINHLQKLTNLALDCEITLEANPTSVEIDNFKAFKNAGVNRISIGVQSFNEKSLKFLGREHSRNEAIKAIEIACSLFDRYTFDLIYALPDQALNDWKEELNLASSLIDKHVSLYQLTIEKGTKFFSLFKDKAFKLSSAKISANLYNYTAEFLETLNLHQYEISNYAKIGEESAHNLNYWRYGDYLGIGPGAHGRITIKNKKYATVMHYNPDIWQQAVQDKGVGLRDNLILGEEEVYQEKIMMGLRLSEGININEFRDSDKLNYLIELGMLVNLNGYITATKKGRLLLNTVISELLI